MPNPRNMLSKAAKASSTSLEALLMVVAILCIMALVLGFFKVAVSMAEKF